MHRCPLTASQHALSNSQACTGSKLTWGIEKILSLTYFRQVIQMSTHLFFWLPTQPLFDHIFELGVCGKPIFRLDSDFENPNRIWTVQVFQIRVDGIPTETACNLQFKLILSKILSFNVQIKNVLKHDRNRVFARNWNGGGWSHDCQSRSWIWCLKHCTPCHAYIWLTQVHIYCTVISNSDIKFYSYDVTKTN